MLKFFEVVAALTIFSIIAESFIYYIFWYF